MLRRRMYRYYPSLWTDPLSSDELQSASKCTVEFVSTGRSYEYDIRIAIPVPVDTTVVQ